MDRIVLVTKPTRFEELVRQHLTEGAARFSLESHGQSIDAYELENDIYRKALAEIRKGLPSDVPVTTLRREDIPNFLFRDTDLIVVCGPDGLFVNLAKYVGNQLIIAVNPDPHRVSGALMLFRPDQVAGLIKNVQAGTHRIEKLPLAKATIDDDRVIWAVNDIFIGRRDHVSARYELSLHGSTERHSSSGIIVSTGVGSTGWISSIIAMISGLTSPGTPHELMVLPEPTDDQLVFVVREPFKTPVTGTSHITGRINPEEPLTVVSEMPDGGYIFSDGVVEDALEWNAGSTVVVTIGDRYVERVIG